MKTLKELEALIGAKKSELAELEAERGAALSDLAWAKIHEPGQKRVTFPMKVERWLHRWHANEIEWLTTIEAIRTGVHAMCDGVQIVFDAHAEEL